MTVWKNRGRRGDALEDLILISNEFYKNHGLARIDKAATPITVVDINEKGLITKGYFEKKSTVDFYGIAQGIYICFDAKETNLKSIPLSNIHEHQIEYMKDINQQNGLAFIIVHFKLFDEYLLVPFETLYDYYHNSNNGGRKSIPYKELDLGFKIERTGSGILNYMEVINKYIEFKNELNRKSK